jgi:preprotein translocase subunit SecA
MKTGEGIETLVATLPASLITITGRGVAYCNGWPLFSRSRSISMGQIYRFLGLDTGLIQMVCQPDQRTAIMLTYYIWRRYMN